MRLAYPAEKTMRNIRVFLVIAALANLAATYWHLYLAVEMHPGMLGAMAPRIAIQASLFTLGGLALLWTRFRKIGSAVLILLLAVGFVIGSLEHFFAAGPYNVFDVGSGRWVLAFDTSVALLVIFQIAGMTAAGRLLLARSPA
jgi:hypothetical protein